MKSNNENSAVLGFSGGVDSVSLAIYLVENRNVRPYLLHVNYSLRAESDEDEQWCRWFAQEHRFKLFVLKVDPKDHPKKNIQNWARDLRYQWFDSMAEELGASTIYTAHHLGDRQETFFMNALRGSGLLSITGMSNSKIDRPFGNWSKEQVLEFAQERNLEWREDASNQTLKYTRNKVRHLLPPVLDEIDHRWQGGLKNTLNNLDRDRALLKGFLDEFKSDYLSEEGGELLLRMGPWMDKDYAHNLFYQLCKSIDIGFSFDEVGHVLRGESGQRVYGNRWMLVRDRKVFYLSKHEPLDKNVYRIDHLDELSSLPFKLSMTQHEVQNVKFGTSKEWIGGGALKFPLEFRLWKAGDSFVPLGMNGRKKVADFLNDLRLPIHHKERTWVMLHQGEILWVIGHRISDGAKVVESDAIAYLAEHK